jgi:hypothetical protein
MKLIERIKNICITPKSEWSVINEEVSSHKSIIIGYILPLAGLSAISIFIGNSFIGQNLPILGSYRIPVSTGLGIAFFSIIMAIVSTWLLSVIINALAPTFGGTKDHLKAFKVAVYSYTPAWVAGLFYIIPFSTLLSIIAAGYGLYLLYLGLPLLMKNNEDKSVGYTALIIFAAIVLSLFINMSVSLIAKMGVIPEELKSSSISNPKAEFDADSPLGKLQDFSQKMEGLNEKMTAAQKQGDQNQQIAVAMESLGTLLGGGKKVEALDIDQLKTFLPDTFAKLPKKSNAAEKSGAMGIAVSKASAVYVDDSGKKVTLEISDMGGVSGLLGLASWVNVQGEQEDEFGSEKTYQSNGRMLHEKSTKNGDNEFSLVIAQRFMLSAKAHGVETAALKEGIMGMNLDQLEALQQGSQK